MSLRFSKREMVSCRTPNAAAIWTCVCCAAKRKSLRVVNSMTRAGADLPVDDQGARVVGRLGVCGQVQAQACGHGCDGEFGFVAIERVAHV